MRTIELRVSLGLHNSITEYRQVAIAAEQLGANTLQISDHITQGCALGIGFMLAPYLSRIKIEIGVLNPYTTHPVNLAVSAIHLNRLYSPGIQLSLGAGNRKALQSLGLDWLHPIAAVTEMIQILQSLLHAKQISIEGSTFTLTNAQVQQPPEHPIPLFVAGRGIKLISSALPLVDGVMLEGIPYAASQAIKTQFTQIAGHPIKLGTHIVLASDTDRTKAIAKAKEIALWSIAFAQEYVLEPMGLSRELVQKVREALPNKQKALAQITDEQLDLFTITGTPRECAEKIQTYQNSAVDILSIEAPPVEPRYRFLTKTLPQIFDYLG